MVCFSKLYLWIQEGGGGGGGRNSSSATDFLTDDNVDFLGGPPVLMTADLFNEDWEALFPDYIFNSKNWTANICDIWLYIDIDIWLC